MIIFPTENTLTFTHVDGREGGVRDSSGIKLWNPDPTFKYKIDFIKQIYATFYLWDPQDDKSEQDTERKYIHLPSEVNVSNQLP